MIWLNSQFFWDGHIWAFLNLGNIFRTENMELSRFILIAPFTEANVILKCRESNASRSNTLLLLEEFLTFQKSMESIEMMNRLLTV